MYDFSLLVGNFVISTKRMELPLPYPNIWREMGWKRSVCHGSWHFIQMKAWPKKSPIPGPTSSIFSTAGKEFLTTFCFASTLGLLSLYM